MVAAVAALATASNAEFLRAQEPTPDRVDHEPSTALVLSGGGSRGLAHLGALVGLEDLGYDPDLVVGTSMGALMGALYAAGYPPEEIQDQVYAVDWGETFTPAPVVLGPDREVRYPLVMIDSDADPLRFNRGFLPQWRANRTLAHLLFDANARARGDFDRLARRYRAVAADLVTGELVVLAEGDLARAVRASMAVPGVLAPVEWNGRTLVDGGLADNLPVGVARDLKAGYIIAVDVRSPADEITGRSPLQVANRALDIMLRNSRHDTAPPDVLIVPAIPPSATSLIFPPDPQPLFELGRESVMRETRWTGPARTGSRPLPLPPDSLVALRIEAPDGALESLARRVFSDVAPGPYDPQGVLSAVDRLYTTGLFEAVWPRVEPGDGDSGAELIVRVEGPPTISLVGGLGFDSDRGGRIWSSVQRSGEAFGAPATVGAAASLTALEQWAEVSARLVFPNWPLLAWTGGAYGKEADVRRFGPDAGSDQEVVRMGSWLGLELHQALSARIATVTLRGEWIQVEDSADGWSAGPAVRLAAPAPKIPIVGLQPELEAEFRWGDFSYRRFEARASHDVHIGPLRTAILADFATTTGNAPADAHPALGEDHAFPGARWGQHRDRVRAIAGLDLAYPIPFQGYLRSRLRLAATAPSVDALDDRAAWSSGGELGVLWRTPLGSLAMSWGANRLGGQMLMASIGQMF